MTHSESDNAPVPAPVPAAEPAPAPPVRKPRRTLPPLRIGAVARPLGALVLVVVALFVAWQAWLLRAQHDAGAEITDAVQRSAPMLVAPLQTAQQKFSAALADPALLAHVDDGGADALAQATTYLRQTLPAAGDVGVYAPNPDILVGSKADTLGYVRAAQLARAQSDGKPSISAVAGAHGERALSLVQPIRRDDRVLAYAAATLPIKPLTQAFYSLGLPDGRFVVRLGNTDDAGVVLSRGEGGDAAIDVAAPIGGSGFWLTATTPVAKAWLPDSLSPAPLWLLSLLALVGAAVLGWGRSLGNLPARVQARRGAGVEPTFAEVLERGPAAGAPAASSPTVPRKAAAADAGVAVDRSIFRAYDIRGVLGSTLNTDVARLIGRAIGSAARERGQNEIVVGRDGRLSGPELSAALIDGLRASGVDVIDIGMAPTPLVYFACYQLNTGSGVAVTGSHNPPDYNGFKIVLGGETLAEEAIQDLYARIAEGRLSEGSGQLRSVDINDDYIERIASDVQTERQLKVVVDCGNGVAGTVGPRVLEAVGCQVIPLYAEVDGNFPNHHPDPSDPHNLEDLILSVKHKQADLGIAFDGDGDRLGVVTRDGEIIYPDRLLMLFAIDVLVRDPGATIIYDVKCTGHLQSVILRHGGSPQMWKTGHSLIKAKMRETNAALAGEMSGHFFFRERWYGFDDGIYAAARLVEILAGDADGRPPEKVFASLPKGVSTPELKIPMAEGEHYRFIERFRKQARFEDARVTTIDGLRADWPDGWGLVRASNTTPVLVLRFDADSNNALKRIQEDFRTQLLAVDPELKLPF
jgi:phosphomannomutase/phosphoglucomutase